MNRTVMHSGFALLVFAAVLAAPSVQAQTVADDAALARRLDDLEQQLKLLKADQRKAALVPEGSELKLGALLQMDGRSFVGDDQAFNDGFVLRRVRPTLDGKFGDAVSFRIMPDFAGDSFTLYDAYVDLKLAEAISLRAGRFKSPMGLERLQSANALVFIERAFPTELAPSRDQGLQLQGQLFGKTTQYQLAYLNGAADGRDVSASRDADNRKEFAGRVFVEPFVAGDSVFKGLGIGLSATYGSKQGSSAGTSGVLPQYRSAGQNVFFRYADGVSAHGDHQRLSPQAWYYHGPLGLMGEYIVSEQAVALSGVERTMRNQAWQVTGSWFLSGEKSAFSGLPKIANKDWGAWQLAARYSELEVDQQAFDLGYANSASSAQQARYAALGVNWFPSARIKFAVDYGVTEFDGGAANDGDRDDETTLFGRIQLSI